MLNFIKIRGAREHNLKSINLDIPKNKFVVFTGVSGSGKSSLAFDTIYAEGQRRYVESLSTYARQFLGIMSKPDVDTIEGLSPAISIDQKATSHNPRSTVGTITEIYDYLRLLFARIGHPYCPNCHLEIRKLSSDEIVERAFEVIKKAVSGNKLKPMQIVVYSPVVRRKKGGFKDLFDNLRAKGYSTVRVDGHEFDLSSDISLIATNKHDIDVEIDSISLNYKNLKSANFIESLLRRLSNNIEQSIKLSDGLVIIKIQTAHLFSERFSCPNCELSLPELEPRMFSFNSPLGACTVCKGIGIVFKVDPDQILNMNLSVNEGAILPLNKLFFKDTWYIRLLKTVSDEENLDFNLPLNDFSKKDLNILLYGTGKTHKVLGTNRQGHHTAIYENFDGIVGELERRFFQSDSAGEMFDIHKYIREEVCKECKGKRLKKEILAVTIDGKNIADISGEAIESLNEYFSFYLPGKLNQYESLIAKGIIKEIQTRLKFLINVGLSYLTISRSAKSLSSGEMQRIRLASQIGTGLTGVLYVLDEPSIGLHPKDVSALIHTLHELKSLGNTLIVVEHDRETIESADHIIELGPHAGNNGGKVVYAGTVKEIKKTKKSLTGAYISRRKKIKLRERKLTKTKGEVILRGASQFNLKNITAEIPLGNFIVVTGVSGSGKSTLIVDTLYPALKYHISGHYSDMVGDFKRLEGFQYLDRAYLVDQSPIGRTPRSNPATYVGFFDEVRDVFANTQDAKIRGFKKSRFSFNLKGGRCEKCQGAGVIKIEMQFLSDIYIKCDICEGKRYNKETLEVKFRDRTIYDILEMTIDEAADFFQNHFNIYQKLSFLKHVGLGYIKLGQPAPTFSGGEAQRIKLSNELSRKDTGRTLYILDEPTTGLHFYDIEKLLGTLHTLVEKGNTVIVIEHNLDVIKNAQYVIDLGLEGGDRGGDVVYQGEIKGIIKNKQSHTGRYLLKHNSI